jgi:hypothetical protein
MTIEDRDGTLIRKDPEPFTPAWIAAHALPHAIPHPTYGSLAPEICSLCRCDWNLPIGEQPKQEWCREPLAGSCECHFPAFIDGYVDAAAEWRRLRDSGLSEGELREAAGR